MWLFLGLILNLCIELFLSDEKYPLFVFAHFLGSFLDSYVVAVFM